MRRVGWVGFAVWFFVPACAGVIDDPGAGSPDPAATPTSPTSALVPGDGLGSIPCTDHQPGPRLLRPLTRLEYAASVRTIYWTNEFGNGGHADEFYNVPIIIAGGGGGAIRSGRYLRLRQPDASTLVPHNRALTSVCHAMGLRNIDFVGDPRVASNPRYRGPLAELMT